MNMQQQLTSEQIAVWQAMRDEGMTLRDIAERCLVATSTIQRYTIKSDNGSRRGRPRSNAIPSPSEARADILETHRQRARAMRAQGATLKAIIRHVGHSEKTVKEWVRDVVKTSDCDVVGCRFCLADIPVVIPSAMTSIYLAETWYQRAHVVCPICDQMFALSDLMRMEDVARLFRARGLILDDSE